MSSMNLKTVQRTGHVRRLDGIYSMQVDYKISHYKNQTPYEGNIQYEGAASRRDYIFMSYKQLKAFLSSKEGCTKALSWSLKLLSWANKRLNSHRVIRWGSVR